MTTTNTDQPSARSRTTRSDETKERILDVAERLFVANGYDGTSLREIAAEMGFSKAALYYHFASKEDILLGLHLRLHAVGVQAIHRHVQGREPTLASWSTLLQEVVHDMVAHRELLILHAQNPAALASIAAKHMHDESHRDFQTEIQSALASKSLSPAERVRLSAAVGGVFFGLVSAGDSLEDITVDEMVAGLQDAVRELLGPGEPG